MHNRAHTLRPVRPKTKHEPSYWYTGTPRSAKFRSLEKDFDDTDGRDLPASTRRIERLEAQGGISLLFSMTQPIVQLVLSDGAGPRVPARGPRKRRDRLDLVLVPTQPLSVGGHLCMFCACSRCLHSVGSACVLRPSHATMASTSRSMDDSSSCAGCCTARLR